MFLSQGRPHGGGERCGWVKKIEGRNGGLVPFRGKSFAQWLHYTFPYESPFPRVTLFFLLAIACLPTVKKVKDDFVDENGATFGAPRSSMEENVSRQPDIWSPTKDDSFSLWNDDEELLTHESCERVSSLWI